ncbi:hypothetical protein AAEU32_11615 [Pseudoalteromonas sp. SSDWG2]|uniref:hypothetical protein n=1 Tax=Pseudoalteromonas sp. SSDWG2 TaxID=3139391 RepID=UPI003BABB721
MNRSHALEQIVTFGNQKDEAYGELIKFGYDAGKAYFVVTKAVLAKILHMYLAQQISSDELEMWANFIECRDDIDYEIVEDFIYSLANPSLMGEITHETIAKMVTLL